jgi:hypothetical protein
VPRLLPTLIALLIAVGTGGQRVSAQVSARPRSKEDDRVKRLEQMTQLARAFKVVAIEGNDRTPLQLATNPLH